MHHDVVSQRECSREESTLRIAGACMPVALSIFVLVVVMIAASVGAPDPGPSWAPVALRAATVAVGLAFVWTLYLVVKTIAGADRK